jgi:hypothetical protein
LARRSTGGWPLVPLLALGPHAFAAALGAPFPRWTLVFPLAGTALLGVAGWRWADWWLGAGVAGRAVRLWPPLRRQLELAAGLVIAGVAIVAVGVPIPFVWTVVVLALIAWALGGAALHADRLHDTPPELT